MINILYLLKVLETNKISVLISNIDAPLLDINLALFEAEDNGEIEIDRKKDKIKALKEATPTCDEKIANKLIRVIQHYSKNEVNISVGKLTSWCKNPAMEHNYLYHEYICALQYLIDTGQVIEDIRTVPKSGKRPFHRFVFLCLPENSEHNEEWNSREINKWLARWESDKVK